MPGLGHRILIVQAVTVIVASIGLALAACLVAERIEEHTASTTRYSDAAINAALIQAQVNELVALGAEDLVKAVVDTQGSGLSSVPLPTLIQARDLLQDSTDRASRIEQSIGSEDGGAIKHAADNAFQSLNAFYANPSAGTFTTFSDNLTVLREQARTLTPVLDSRADSSLGSLEDMAIGTRWVLVVAALLSGSIITTTTYLLGRRLTEGREELRQERDSLIETSAVMNRRNEQFSALYQVVTEVSENLSTRYVVNTTVREARPLVGADLVVMRLLREDELVVVGMEAADNLDVGSIGTIILGSGFAGRSAKRGRTIRIAENAEHEMTDNEGVAGVQSGVIVPLIVGARVVGTMSAWSCQAHHFSDDDERILEMMASQVASAVAAAGSFEASEKNANLDALTGLANRRQLAEDIDGFFKSDAFQSETHSFAMIDIDNFGMFNKDFGHRIGDITLQKVAHVLKNTLRESDRLYRYGGEEFLVVIKCPLAEAVQVAEHLRRAVADAPLTGEQSEPIGPVTISLGLAGFPLHGDTYEVVAERADQALRVSKRLGRNRVTTWSPELTLEAVA
jgi:diguanylate cyclase (GGDEF)-like protein